MTLLSRRMESGPSDGTTRAATVRVIPPRVNEKSMNPATCIGTPFAGLRETAAGGTGFRGTSRRVGCVCSQPSETTETSVAVSIVMLVTGHPSTEPSTRTRREENNRDKGCCLCASLQLYHTWSEFFSLSGEMLPFSLLPRNTERRGRKRLRLPALHDTAGEVDTGGSANVTTERFEDSDTG